MYTKALIMGLGSSGAAAAGLLLEDGTKVTVIDAADNSGLRHSARSLKAGGVEVILGTDSIPDTSFDVCVVSPGISGDSKWVRAAESAGLEVISELELGARRCGCRMLAVTGSKGKSTMVKFCADALTLAGKHVAVAGNYGPPLCSIVKHSRKLDWVVVEVSSFQLEKVKNFKPDVGVLLNIQPDHLDRHGSIKEYAAVKARMFSRMTGGNVGIVLENDMSLIRKLSGGLNRWFCFGLSARADYRYANGFVSYTDHGRKEMLDLRNTIFANDILGLSAAASVAAIRCCGVSAKIVEDAARSFNPLPHRMQFVAESCGVRFINDSKATNLAALAAGVTMCKGPVRLIAGGLLKENRLNFVKKTLAKRVTAVYLVGKAARKMAKYWGDAVRCVRCGSLQKAVRLARKDSNKGDFVLLSPGCASFDQFEDFEDRGKKFVQIVKKLIQRGAVK